MVDLHLDLTDLVERRRASLLESAPHAVAYVDIQDLRSNELPSEMGASPVNIYALWTRAQGGDWSLKYIGQRTIREGWRRVREHLFWKHAKT